MHASVVIIGFNGIAVIDDCVRSVLDQEFPRTEYEVILVDNASGDGTSDFVAQQYPDVRVIRLPENYGFNEACNKSISYVAADFIVFVPQDAIVHQQWLASFVRLAEQDQNIKVCWSNTMYSGRQKYGAIDRQGMPKHINLPTLTIFGFSKTKILPYSSMPIFTLGVAGISFGIKKDCLKELSTILDGSFVHYCGDTDLGLRVNLQGYKVALSPTAVTYHRDANKSLMNLALLRRYFLGTVDRIVLFYKCMSLVEFVLFSPFLIIGIAAKSFSLRLPILIQGVLFVVVLPLAPLIFICSLLFVGKVQRARVVVQANRAREELWLLKKIFRRTY